MINILLAHSSLGNGGITNVLKEIVRWINKERFHIDILMYKGGDTAYQEYFESLGCQVYEAINPRDNYHACKEFIAQLNEEKKYSVIHSCNYLNSGYLMQIGRELNIPIRIVHSHASQDFQTNIKYRLYKWLMQRKIKKNATDFIACSDKAGEYLFEKHPFIVIENAIDAQSLCFSEAKRNQIRDMYSFSKDDIVIGMVGMITEIKNQTFMLDVLNKLDATYKLLIVGDGEKREEVENKIRALNLHDRVQITGWVKSAKDNYSCFDIFVMPSLSEGFPLSGLEAQANGLATIFSDCVTKSLKLSESVSFLPIGKEHIDLWKKEIMNKAYKRMNRSNTVIGTDYDIHENIKKWEKLYQSIKS